MEITSNHCAQQDTREVQLNYQCSNPLKWNWYKLCHCLGPHTSLHRCLPIAVSVTHTQSLDFYSHRPKFPADVMIRLQMINNCFII